MKDHEEEEEVHCVTTILHWKQAQRKNYVETNVEKAVQQQTCGQSYGRDVHVILLRIQIDRK